MKEEYVAKINELLEACTDVTLLEFIVKMLTVTNKGRF